MHSPDRLRDALPFWRIACRIRWWEEESSNQLGSRIYFVSHGHPKADSEDKKAKTPPSTTPFVPSARNLTPCVPLLIPPSTITSQIAKPRGQIFQIYMSVSSAVGALSNCRPLLLESGKWTSFSLHISASSLVWILLIAIGRSVKSRGHFTADVRPKVFHIALFTVLTKHTRNKEGYPTNSFRARVYSKTLNNFLRVIWIL